MCVSLPDYYLTADGFPAKFPLLQVELEDVAKSNTMAMQFNEKSPSNKEELAAVRHRLEAAIEALLAAKCFGQAVARAYYLVYHYVRFVGRLNGVRVKHSYEPDHPTFHYDHVDIPDVAEAIFNGGNPGHQSCVIQGGPKIQSLATTLDPWDICNQLKKSRILADYIGQREDIPEATALRLIEQARQIRSELQLLVR